MFNFRRKAAPKRYPIEVVGVEGDKIRFKTEEDLAMGSQLVEFEVEGEKIEAGFSVEGYLPQHDAWEAVLEEPEELMERLRILFPEPIPEAEEEPEPTWEEKRSVDRVVKRLGVMCKQFKHFKGLTHDLTAQGARFISEGPQDPGAQLDIRLEIDDARVDAIHFKAEVVWCQPVDQEAKKYFLGCKIFLDDEQKEIVDNFLDFFRNYSDEVFSELYAHARPTGRE